jgi:hypothetical protein
MTLEHRCRPFSRLREARDPVVELAVEIVDGGGLARRKEAVAQVLDRALDLALLVASGGRAPQVGPSGRELLSRVPDGESAVPAAEKRDGQQDRRHGDSSCWRGVS